MRRCFIPKASELTTDTRFVGLFVGDSGSGKTVAEASFPGPVHFNDFDGRIRGLLGAPWIDRKNITYDFFPPKDPNLIEKLNNNLETLLAAARTGVGVVPNTLVTDSITSECYAFICQSIPLTHNTGKNPAAGGKKGKFLGPISMPGPEDYGLEAQATYDYIAFLKSLPIPNIIVSAHFVDKYDRPKDEHGETLTYADTIVVGKKLSIRDKIGTNIKINFDHIFEFEREIINRQEKFYVTFRGELARTSYLGLPIGRHDITGKNFYDELQKLIKGESK